MRIANPTLAAALQRGQLAGADALGTRSGAAAGVEEAKGGDFGQMLTDALKDVNKAQQDSKAIQEDLISNRKPVEVHDVMITMEKASTAMQLTFAVRNKMLEAYQEISRMQV